jgi:hypothetical protein
MQAFEGIISSAYLSVGYMDFTLKYPFYLVFHFSLYFFGFWSNLPFSFDSAFTIVLQKRGMKYVVDSLPAVECETVGTFANFGKYVKRSVNLEC